MAIGTILSFKGVHAYCDYWDKRIEEAMRENGEYARGLTEMRNDIERSLRQGSTNSNLTDYGEPVPSSYEDAMARKTFQNMLLYRNSWNELQPLLASLEKVSEGIMPKEVIKPTDLEIGIFSFERASMSLDAIPSLYCEKDKKFYPLEDGEELLDKNGIHLLTKDGKLRYKIKSNGFDAVLEQLVEDGVKRFSSSNKKSFLRKEKAPRPNRLIRLFILTGANAGQPTYFAGLCGIITAIYLESKGYAVRITGVLGVSMTINHKGQNQEGTRFSMIDLKAYDETIDSLSLLYFLADSSFFRVRQFNYYLAQQFKYQDPYYEYLGRMPDVSTFRTMLFDKVKERDIAEEKGVLYYFFGGSEITNMQSAKDQIVSIVCSAENDNREALQRLGYQFDPIQPTSGRKVGDVDCP
jgi:hypothetical protein